MHIFDEDERLRAPEIRASAWLNVEHPLTLAELRGRVVIVDFWDHTCINCLHTLPYLIEWHQRYHALGLTILGVHAAEFAFGNSPELLEAAVQQLGVPYPVALDDNYTTWKAYANRCWPAKYLLDATGRVRAYHFGEGAYDAFEEQIQALLREAHPGQTLDLPPLMKPVHDFDEPGTLCLRPTPELYLGYKRGEFGNREGQPPEQAVRYAMPEHLLLDTIFLDGAWFNGPESIEKVDEAPAQIVVAYRAAEVNLVLAPPLDRPTMVYLTQDGEFIDEAHWGADVQRDEFGKPFVLVDRPKMVRLVKNPDFEQHTLALSVPDKGTRAYAFTFVSCPSRDTALA